MKLKKITGIIALFMVLLACTELRSQMSLNLFQTEIVPGSEQIATLSNGDLCITATRVENSVEKAFISRCNASGTPIWIKDLGIGTSPRINDLVIDAAGNAGFCGSYVTAGTTRAAFVSRFDMSTQTLLLHKTWQSNSTEATNIMATASGKEYIVSGSWETTTSSQTSPSMFVASVDISGNGTGISWFKDIYNSVRTVGVGLLGSFHPTAMCETKDGYAISYYRLYVNITDAWTFLILKNGSLIFNPSSSTNVFTEVDINFNRTSTLGYGQGKVFNAIGDLSSNVATLFYATASTSSRANAEEGIASVIVTYNLGGPAVVGNQSFLRVTTSPVIGLLRMRSMVYDNNEVYLSGSIGTTNHDAYLVHFDRNTFSFTNAYRLNYAASQDEMMHITGTVGNLSCSYTSDGYGTFAKMLAGPLSLASLGGTCELSADVFDDFDHDNATNGYCWFYDQSQTTNTSSPPVTPVIIPTLQHCEPCPETDRSTLDLTYCNTGNVTGRWYQPCNVLAAGEKYVLTGIGNGYAYDSEIGYDDNGNHISGCIAHFLLAGSYKFSFYNEVGCLTKEIIVNVAELTPTLTISLVTNLSYCALPGVNGMWVSPCDLLVPPANFMYTMEDLAVMPPFPMYNSEDWAAAHGGNGCISHFLGDGSYKVKMYDKDNCTYTELTINISHTTPTLTVSFGINLSYCALPGVNGMWINPCDNVLLAPGDFMYTLEDMGAPPAFPMYNSDLGSGCISHFLGDGTYRLRIYDKTNCTYTEETIIISHTTPTLTISFGMNLSYCALPGVNGMWINPCDNILLAPGDFMYTLEDMGAPPAFPMYNSDLGGGCISHFLGDGTYRLRIYDKTNCTYTEETIIISHTTPTLTISLSTNLTYCAMDGANGMWVSPCDLLVPPANFMYTMEDLAVMPPFPMYNSDDWAAAHGGNGCISHFLGDGSYKVKMYDKDNCTYIELTINISSIAPTATQCIRHIDLPCGQPDPNLDEIEIDCPECNQSVNAEVGPWITESVGTLPLSLAKVVTRTIIDRVNCRICIFKVIIEHVDPVVEIRSIHITAHCPLVQTINIRSLFTLSPAIGPIYSWNDPGSLIPSQMPGDVFSFCCPVPENTSYFFEAMGADGCLHRLKVIVDCEEALMMPHSNAKVAGSGKENGNEQSSRQMPGTKTSSENLLISPNPSTGIFNLNYLCSDGKAIQNGTYAVEITDISGQVVYTRSGLKVNTSESFDLTQFASGVYTVKVTYGDTVRFVKLVKN